MPVPRPVTVVLALALLLPAPGAHARKKGGKKRKPKVHVVQEGDILGDIAARHGCSIAELKAANRLERDLIRIGDRLTVPRCSGRRQPHAGEGRSRVVRHTVIPGETLGSIARRHGTTIDAIQRRNRLDGHVIRAGQVLKVRARIPVRQRREFVYTVKRGDTLGKIGARYKMEWEDIRRMNPGVRPRRLRVGDRLRLWRDGPVPNSEAVGRPQEGRLVNGEQLPAGPGYYRRRPGRSWGTNETITRLLQVIATVRRKHRRLHDIAIGDLSAKKGGPLPGHASHQSGRDVDIGLLHARYPPQGLHQARQAPSAGLPGDVDPAHRPGRQLGRRRQRRVCLPRPPAAEAHLRLGARQRQAEEALGPHVPVPGRPGSGAARAPPRRPRARAVPVPEAEPGLSLRAETRRTAR